MAVWLRINDFWVNIEWDHTVILYASLHIVHLNCTLFERQVSKCTIIDIDHQIAFICLINRLEYRSKIKGTNDQVLQLKQETRSK